jgi:dTDP-glucose 4,6-dehydratase
VIESGAVGETYNIGGDNEWTNIDLVRQLCAQMDRVFADAPSLAARFPDSPASRGESAELITFVTDRKGHDRRYAIDGDKVADELGFRAQTPFEEGLRSTIRWYLDNEAWWRAVMDGSYREWVATNYRS